MPLSRRTAGWKTIKGTPPPPTYPDTQHKAWTTQDYREQITPCLDMNFTQAGKGTLWTTKMGAMYRGLPPPPHILSLL